MFRGEGVDAPLEWRVDERRGATLEALAIELKRVATLPRATPRRGDAPHEPRELVIELTAGMPWSDVVAITDVAHLAALRAVRWHGVDADRIVPKAIAPAGADAPRLPNAACSEPDDEPDALRPTFDLFRDGRIVENGAILFAPIRGAIDDYGPLRARLAELRGECERRGDVDPPNGALLPRLTVPVLLRVDRGASWNSVRQLLARTDAVGFRRIEFGVLGHARAEHGNPR